MASALRASMAWGVSAWANRRGVTWAVVLSWVRRLRMVAARTRNGVVPRAAIASTRGVSQAGRAARSAAIASWISESIIGSRNGP